MNLILKLSQLNGLIGDLFGFLGNFVQNLINALIGALLVGFYQLLVVPIMMLADGIQLFFRKLAGLDTYYVGNDPQSGDIVLSLINNKTIQDVFWALLILAVVLLIITTIVALVRSETQAMDSKDRKTKSKIFSESIRALFNFFMIPVVAILGIFMGNALLKSLDKATSGSSTTRVSTYIFRAAAYEANRARKDETFALDIRDKHINDMAVLTGSNQEEIAAAIDSAFMNFTTFESQIVWLPGVNIFSGDGTYSYVLTLTMFSSSTFLIPRDCFSVYDAHMVFYYYDLASFNFIICFIGLFFAIYVMFVTAIGLIKRIFKLTMLLIVSPPIVAVSPLDNGQAVGKWKKAFIGSALSAYGTVVAFNLMFLILGPLTQIELFKNAVAGIDFVFLNNIATLLIVIAALLYFKDFTKELGEIIGAEDAYGSGAKVTGEMAKKVAQGAMIATGGVGAVKNMIKSKTAAAAGDTKTAEKFKAMSQARFKQARSNFASLSTNGISDNIEKMVDDSEKKSGVKDARKGLNEADENGRTANDKIKQIKQDAREEKLSRWEQKGGIRKLAAKAERNTEKAGAWIKDKTKKVGGVALGPVAATALGGPVGLVVFGASKGKKAIEGRKAKKHNEEITKKAEEFSSTSDVDGKLDELKSQLGNSKGKKEKRDLQRQIDEMQEVRQKVQEREAAAEIAKTKAIEEAKANEEAKTNEVNKKPKATKKKKNRNIKSWKPKNKK